MNNNDAVEYISSLLGRMFRIHTVDERMFVGEFKCTDSVNFLAMLRFIWRLRRINGLQESNIILSKTYEYRMPTMSRQEAATAESEAAGLSTARANMTSRFMGLVVVPGHFIERIEVEEKPERSSDLPLRPV